MNRKEFWQTVYIASVQAGKSYLDAADRADDALNELDERWPDEEEDE